MPFFLAHSFNSLNVFILVGKKDFLFLQINEIFNSGRRKRKTFFFTHFLMQQKQQVLIPEQSGQH